MNKKRLSDRIQSCLFETPGSPAPFGERSGSRRLLDQRGSSSAEPVPPEPGSETRLPGATFRCRPAVSPACRATQPAGAALQPPPSWSCPGGCLAGALSGNSRDRSRLPPSPPHGRAPQTLYKPLSAAGTRGEFSLSPLPSRLTGTSGCHPRGGRVPAPRSRPRGLRCHLRVPPPLWKGPPSPAPKARFCTPAGTRGAPAGRRRRRAAGVSAPEGQRAGGSAAPASTPSRQGSIKRSEHLPLKPSLGAPSPSSEVA